MNQLENMINKYLDSFNININIKWIRTGSKLTKMVCEILTDNKKYVMS